ncbi:hypothetical protein I7I48_06497 [Histoplasma ohiense]|nr:hypothetical protein I7I48_06497 [Histoplasma ohiense (nom. inval.)]
MRSLAILKNMGPWLGLTHPCFHRSRHPSASGYLSCGCQTPCNSCRRLKVPTAQTTDKSVKRTNLVEGFTTTPKGSILKVAVTCSSRYSFIRICMVHKICLSLDLWLCDLNTPDTHSIMFPLILAAASHCYDVG